MRSPASVCLGGAGRQCIEAVLPLASARYVSTGAVHIKDVDQAAPKDDSRDVCAGRGGVGLVGDRSGGNEAAAHHDDDLARLYVQNLDPLHGNVSSEPPALPVDHWGLLPQRHQRSRPCGIKLADRHPVADAEEAELRR